MVGEALAYVQGCGLKAIAVVCRRLTNSPAAREIWWPFSWEQIWELQTMHREYTRENIQELNALATCIVMRQADAAMRSFCALLESNNLKVSPEVLAKIPIKPQTETQN